MKIRTLLVDSSYLLKRSFHGAKDIQTTKFGYIGGLYSFLTTIRKLIKEHMINKVVLIWDGEGGGVYRYRIDKDYKSNRKSKDWHKKIELSAAEIRREKAKEESILKQRKRIQEYAEELFLRQIEVDDIEADDLIAEYCLEHNNKEEIILYSNDRDFAQLLDLNITIIFPNISQPVNKTNYIMYFNHHYTNTLVMKIICGDSSDNIHGIKGIGEDTLIKHFPELKFKHVSVKEICKRADEINKERVENKKKPLKALEALISPDGINRLKTNFRLINLRKPILNEQAKEELLQLETPLSPEDRGSKNLYNLMIEDDFLSVYGSNFTQYVEPFYTVIMNEKQLLTEYLKNNKNRL
jgi:5'-3' exonuclease